MSSKSFDHEVKMAFDRISRIDRIFSQEKWGWNIEIFFPSHYSIIPPFQVVSCGYRLKK